MRALVHESYGAGAPLFCLKPVVNFLTFLGQQCFCRVQAGEVFKILRDHICVDHRPNFLKKHPHLPSFFPRHRHNNHKRVGAAAKNTEKSQVFSGPQGDFLQGVFAGRRFVILK
jgi:hypothetical protein